MLNALKTSPLARSLISATAGFIGYGAWAYWVNQMVSHSVGIKAALVQGSFSFVITLVLSALMEFLHQRFASLRYGNYVTIMVACLILYISSYSINFIAGTPNIIRTILPGALFSTFYVWGYVFSLNKLAENTNA